MNFLIYSAFNKDNDKQITELQKLKELVDALRSKEIIKVIEEKPISAPAQLPVILEKKQTPVTKLVSAEVTATVPAKTTATVPAEVTATVPAGIPVIMRKIPTPVTTQVTTPKIKPIITPVTAPKTTPVTTPITAPKIKQITTPVLLTEPKKVPVMPVTPTISSVGPVTTVSYIDLKNLIDNYNNFMHIVYELYNNSIRSYNKHFNFNLKELSYSPIKLEPTVVPYIDAIDKLHQNLVNNVNTIYDKLYIIFELITI